VTLLFSIFSFVRRRKPEESERRNLRIETVITKRKGNTVVTGADCKGMATTMLYRRRLLSTAIVREILLYFLNKEFFDNTLKYYGMSLHRNLIRRLCKYECINRILHMQSLQIWNLNMHFVSNFDILYSSYHIPSSAIIHDVLVLQIQVLLLLLSLLPREIQEILS